MPTRCGPLLSAVGLLLALGWAGPASAQAPAQPPPPTVRVDAVHMTDMVETIDLPATVHARHDARVAAEIAGRIVWIAEVGDRVEAGAPLARIDDRDLRIRLEELSVQVRSLETQTALQERELARLRTLARSEAAAARRVEQAEADHARLEQDLARARGQQAQAALDLERTVVAAPFAGQVVERLLEPGEFPARGAPVARLISPGDVELRLRAPVDLARVLSEGAAVAVKGPGGAVQATVARVVPLGEVPARTVELRVALPGGAWIVGEAATVTLPTSRPRPALTVHRDAVVLRAAGAHLWRIAADGTAEQVPVRTGLVNGDRVEVVPQVPLAEGDRVVVRGAERLRPGQAVTIQGAAGETGG